MNFDALISEVSQSANTSWSNIQSISTPAALNSPVDMLKLQEEFQYYSNGVSLASAEIKTLKDLISGIIQKI